MSPLAVPACCHIVQDFVCVCCAFVCFLNAYECLCLLLLQTQSQAMQNEVRIVAVHQRLFAVSSDIPSTNALLCFCSQLFGRLPRVPRAVYMVVLENDWVQSNWAFRSCKNPLVTPGLFFPVKWIFQEIIVEYVSSSLSSVCLAPSRKRVV